VTPVLAKSATTGLVNIAANDLLKTCNPEEVFLTWFDVEILVPP
jgi:hypothetical protein